MGGFRFIDHTADVGVVAQGPTRAEVLAATARGMFEILGYRVSAGTGPADAAPGVHIRVTAPDPVRLLVDWLNELLFLHEVDGLTPAELTITEATDNLVSAVAVGQASRDPALVRHEIKAVTFHQARFEQGPGGEYVAQVIFDL